MGRGIVPEQRTQRTVALAATLLVAVVPLLVVACASHQPPASPTRSRSDVAAGSNAASAAPAGIASEPQVAAHFNHANPAIVLSESTLVQLREYILPGAEDLAWETIPWRPSLWEAVVEGDRSDRPILLWAMNGHPLGCT